MSGKLRGATTVQKAPTRALSVDSGTFGGGRATESHAEANDGLLVALPWPPTVNTYYRYVVVNGHPRVLISATGRKYAEAVGLCLAGVRARAPAPPHEVRVALHAPTRARLDLDNRMKGLLDSIYRALGLDDSVIDRLVIERGPVLAGGRALVLIRPLPAQPGEGEDA